jgi:hypothetical protein
VSTPRTLEAVLAANWSDGQRQTRTGKKRLNILKKKLEKLRKKMELRKKRFWMEFWREISRHSAAFHHWHQLHLGSKKKTIDSIHSPVCPIHMTVSTENVTPSRNQGK